MRRKPALRHDRGDDGNGGIIRRPQRAIVLPDNAFCWCMRPPIFSPSKLPKTAEALRKRAQGGNGEIDPGCIKTLTDQKSSRKLPRFLRFWCATHVVPVMLLCIEPRVIWRRRLCIGGRRETSLAREGKNISRLRAPFYGAAARPPLHRRERSSPVKNRKREICTSGSARGRGGNIPTYSAQDSERVFQGHWNTLRVDACHAKHLVRAFGCPQGMLGRWVGQRVDWFRSTRSPHRRDRACLYQPHGGVVAPWCAAG